MGNYDNFWSKAGPGLLDAGLGLYTKNAGQHEAADRLGKAQGPLYQSSMAGAKGMLDMAGNFDPQAFAKQRFDAQQALIAPVQEKDFNDFYRNLYAKGQLGMANYNPGVEGITPNGQAMNPQMAAFFAAKNAQRSKDANASLGEGQKYIDSLLDRSGMLSRQAGQAQGTGLEAQRTQPSRAAGNAEVLRGFGGVLKDSGVAKNVMGRIPGMIGAGSDWLGKLAGNMWNPAPDLSGVGDFSSGMYGTSGFMPTDFSMPDFSQLDLSGVGDFSNFWG